MSARGQDPSERGGAWAGEVGCVALSLVSVLPRALRSGLWPAVEYLAPRGRRRATLEQRPREVPGRKPPGLPDPSEAEELGAAPQPLPFRRSFPFPTNGLCFHFLFTSSAP